MIGLFKKILKEKSFIAIFILFIIITIYCYRGIVNIKIEMFDDNVMSLYSYFLPITFKDNTEFFSIILSISYSMIICYILIHFLNYIFIISSSSIITRIERKKVIKELILINILYVIGIFIIYSIIFLLYNKYHITFNINIIYLLLIKILLTILMPLIYLFIYINTSSPFLGAGILTFSSIVIELLLQSLFDFNKLVFNYPLLIIILLCMIILFLYKIIIHLFERRDI